MADPVAPMHLTEDAEVVSYAPRHYLYVEKTGPFSKTAGQAWGEIHGFVGSYIKENHEITGYLSQYKILGGLVGDNLYRAGVWIAEKPDTSKLPSGLEYCLTEGGCYARFVLTGPFSHLPEACTRAYKVVEEKKIRLAPNKWNLERYMNDPKITPPDQLKTHILLAVPTTDTATPIND